MPVKWISARLHAFQYFFWRCLWEEDINILQWKISDRKSFLPRPIVGLGYVGAFIQQGKGPSRGPLRHCVNFAKVSCQLSYILMRPPLMMAGVDNNPPPLPLLRCSPLCASAPCQEYKPEPSQQTWSGYNTDKCVTQPHSSFWWVL